MNKIWLKCQLNDQNGQNWSKKLKSIDFLIKFDLFDWFQLNLVYFQSLSNFSIKSGHNIINFVMMMQIPKMSGIKNVDIKSIWIWFQLKSRPRSIQSTTLTRLPWFQNVFWISCFLNFVEIYYLQFLTKVFCWAMAHKT